MIRFFDRRRAQAKKQMALVLDRAVVTDPDGLLRLFGFRVASRPAEGDVKWRIGKKVLTQERALRVIRSVTEKA